MIKLRDYQVKAVRDIFKAWKTHRRVLFVLPTGGGKTVIAARVLEQRLRSGDRILVLAHRKELLNQMWNALIAAGLDPEDLGVIRAGEIERDNPFGMIQIASVSTLRNRKKPGSDIVCIDEAHLSRAETYVQIMSWYPEAKVLGLTATPMRMDGKPLRDSFDVMVEGPKPSELIAREMLAKPRLLTKPGFELDLKGVDVSAGDFNLRQLGALVNRKELVGDIVAHWIKHAKGRRTVAFCVNKAHVKRVVTAFQRKGVKASAVLGDTPPDERARLLGPNGDLAKGKIKVIATCGVVSEGWDLPVVKCAILARPTRSETLYLQQTGRIGRAHENTEALILDHSGNVFIHDEPYRDREWSLEEERKPVGRKGKPPMKGCPNCGTILMTGLAECEECGYEFDMRTLEEVDGELVDLSAALEAARVAEEKRVREAIASLGREFPADFVEKVVAGRVGTV